MVWPVYTQNMAAGSKFWINKLHPPKAVTKPNTSEVRSSEFMPYCVIIKAPLCRNFRSEDLRTLNNASSEFNIATLFIAFIHKLPHNVFYVGYGLTRDCEDYLSRV